MVGMSRRHVVVATGLGPVTIVADGECVVGLYFDDQARRPDDSRFGDDVSSVPDPLLVAASSQLAEYFAGERTTFHLPLALTGTDFQRKVWAVLEEIPFGETVTYGWVAERLGGKGLSYAVGQAVGSNPIGVIVPCHRVIGSDGSLTGYAGGLERKQALLTLEEPPAEDAGRLF